MAKIREPKSLPRRGVKTHGGKSLPLLRLIRLGLRQFAAGMLSVLAVGILNRVMKVEMGLDLRLISMVIGIHYFAAPLAIPLGHRSDRHPYFGFHRTPYILVGTLITAAATIAAPSVALNLESTDGSLPAALLAGAVFLLLGTGMYTTGTAYLSLIADLTPERERGKAVAVVWSMMMIGILAGVFLGVGILEQYSQDRLIALFVIMGAIVMGLTLISVWGIEPPLHAMPSSDAITGRQAWALMISGRQTRIFFLFLFSGILFLFLQNVVLEPFGGDVLGMSVGETTRFNAFQMVGVLSGMALAGSWLSNRWGNKLTVGMGLLISSISFIALGLVSLTHGTHWVNMIVLLMGFGMGLFNVGGLAIMMGMSVGGRTGIYMGAWTLAQAMANGLASVGGGLVHDVVLLISNSEAVAYASIFFLEAFGLIVTFALLQRLSVAQFHQEALSTPLT
ncbi:MAG TPA: BCD family MFS transporter [Anaerolineae bacterium]|nr:BCD family MFS transporter [Anaerolineae bacterium]